MATPTGKILKAGAAKVDICPEKGIQIAGDIGRNRGCTGIIDPIYTRALVLEQDGRKFCILSIDTLLVDTPWMIEIRKRIQKAHGIGPDAVVVHATQNHASPSIGNHFCDDDCKLVPDKYPWLRGGDERYNEFALSCIMKSVDEAIRKLTPVTVAAGRTVDGRVGVVRRYVMRDGTSLCQPKNCDPNILHVEGPADPEVGVVTFTAADGKVVSALLHYTSHPCNGFWGHDVMPDWPGAWCVEMENHFGNGCVPLIINGCCGNIITNNFIDPDQPDFNDYKLFGRQLAQSTKRALEKMTPLTDTTLSWKVETLNIPRRKIPTDVLERCKKLIAENPEPIWKDPIRVTWEWVYAIGIIDMAKDVDKMFPYEMQAMRIGDFGLLAIGGEPFAETQLKIKAGSPFAFTQVAHMCHGYVSYVPTKQALKGGGYETNIGRGSRLHADAAEMIEKAGPELLQKLQKS